MMKIGKSAINILINFSNRLYGEAVKSLLTNEQTPGKNQQYIVECGTPDEKFVPDIILADSYSLAQGVHSRYSDAKVFLIDTGLELEVIASILFSHNIDGLLSRDTDMQLFKKALRVVGSGKTWLHNKRVKTFLRKSGFLPGRER